jgi:hypothetical protein
MRRTGLILLLITLLASCSSRRDEATAPLFVAHKSSRTGLQFVNRLSYAPAFNLFNYMYFYNGSGVGAGDFNNDGKIDLFFGSNQGQNTLYLNGGNLRFRDVTTAAGIPNDKGWTTGISVVDINNDGWLDIYVCRVGKYQTLDSRNQFLINQGIGNDSIPRFVDRAAEMGLDFSGFSTQAAFFDYDNDADLDLFLLNHSVHQNNNFRPREVFQNTYDTLSGDRIYQNNTSNAGGRTTMLFSDVTRQTGINSTAISYGLGVALGDINNDGFADLYIGNDFHENDYLYLNQKNGTFRDESAVCLMHTSQYSMGVDIADINNDAQPEIISMDMLPADPYILKRSLGEDTWDLFHEKIRMGYFRQFTRNNLQYNRGNGMFSETGLYSGIAATDWSWAPLWMDFDNDGLKDLFISNGIPKRMNDIDYVNFVTSSEVQQKIGLNNMQDKDLSLIQKFPEIKIPNKFYHNEGNLRFEDQEALIGNNEPNFSNGAVYADFDNDGDLDIVVNNIDDPVTLYENKSAGKSALTACELILNGPELNRNAVGARLLVYAGEQIRSYEQWPTKGFLSSMQLPLHVGLQNVSVDSAFLIWPDRTFQPVELKPGRQIFVYKNGLPVFDFRRLQQKPKQAWITEDITSQTGLSFLHRENHFVEFDREPLIPHMVSTESPCTAVADINRDGLDDLFIGSARDQQGAVFLQQASGRFVLLPQPALAADSSYEDTHAVWADVNNDGSPDLIVASGGNEFYGQDAHNTPRIYRNDGKGNLHRMDNPFGAVFLTASCIATTDVNKDGYVDIFIGARATPWAYGEIPRSYLFLNNKNGTFTDATQRLANSLAAVGMVTSAQWTDLEGDGDDDLLLSLEWDGLVAFINDKGRFQKRQLTANKGWWNFVRPVDVNGDGLVDLVAGNLGLNSRLKATPAEPVSLYYNDFDGNGKKEQLLTYYLAGKEIPFANKAELEKQLPVMKKKFLYAEDLAKASLADLFGDEKLSAAKKFTADYFANAVFINKGALQFEAVALPWQAQLSTYRDAAIVDVNKDNLPDIFLAGNFYGSNIEMGYYDADYGTLLLNNGKGQFTYSGMGDVVVKGQVRRIQPLVVNGQPAFVLAQNNDAARIIRFRQNPAYITGQ